jgi:hypothetical protein
LSAHGFEEKKSQINPWADLPPRNKRNKKTALIDYSPYFPLNLDIKYYI